MGDPQGYLKLKRSKGKYRPVEARLKDYKDVAVDREEQTSKEQASRCMDCGTPFCHSNCPVSNIIPDWNDMMFNGKWENAVRSLLSTNNLPEITGRVCPSLCEFGCVLSINDDAVTIRENELAIIEYAFANGYVKPNPPKKRTGKKIAVIGSGPSGLSAADELNQMGHKVTVFEKDEKPGGIMRYGIPDFKLEKTVLDRRIAIWKKEGIVFKANINIGIDIIAADLKKEFDAVLIAAGSRKPRDLNIEGRDLKGVYFAMDYLMQSNRRVDGKVIEKDKIIDAKGNKVVVIGGGDTGSDCVGTANRQGAENVVQVELLPKAPVCRPDTTPWPKYPNLLKTTTSHEEGSDRLWAVQTKRFVGENGNIKGLECANVEFIYDEKGCQTIKEINGSKFDIPADMVILAMGFVHPQHEGLLDSLKLKYDSRGNIMTDEQYMTSQKGVFAAGDARRGQSLIVWAVNEGRNAAANIDKFLT